MYPRNEIARAASLTYRLSNGRGYDSNTWQPLADKAWFIAKPMRCNKIPRNYFDPDSIYVGTIELSGLIEVAMLELVDPQIDVILDLRYTNPISGATGIPLDELKIGPLIRIKRTG